jgi:hypothetical protein
MAFCRLGMIKRSLLQVILVLLALGAVGCSSIDRPEQPANTGFISLEQGTHLGQTFVATYDGLIGGMVFLKPAERGEGVLCFHLRSDPLETQDLQSAALPLKNLKEPGIYHYQFLPLNSSVRQYYYLDVELDGSGRVDVGTASADTYLNGALYQDGDPQEAQLTFGLIYDGTSLALGLLKEGLAWLLMLAAVLLAFIVPGWALLSWLWVGWKELFWAEKLALAGGVSVALYPVLFLWTDLFGLHLGALYAWLPPLAGLVAIAWQKIAARQKSSPLQGTSKVRSLRPWFVQQVEGFSSNLWPNLALVLVIGLVIAVRFWVIRQLDFPLWGDSYQHTVMAQLLVDHGGLFDSWQPYAEMTTFTYHFGFHAQAAVWHWITGLDLPHSVLWVGQILNALGVVTLIPLAMRLHRSPWAALGAVTLAGLLSPMPMYYVNWGRYTQLAGQVILPVAIYLIWRILEPPAPGEAQWNVRHAALCWITLGGLALTHYRVLIFAVLFYPAYLLLNLKRYPFKILIARIVWSGIGAALIFLPWFVHVFSGQLMAITSGQLTAPVGQGSDLSVTVSNAFAYLPEAVWLCLPPLFIWGLWRRERNTLVIGLWWLILFLAVNPQWFGLSGASVISNFAVLIATYLPASLLVGGATGWLIQSLKPLEVKSVRLHKASLFIAATLLCLGALWGARQRLQDIQVASHALATRTDLRAAAWIEENLPEEAHFLVNSFTAYGGSAVAGSDGGWWLPIIAHRSTTLPPLTYVAESGPRPDYRIWVNSLTQEIEAKGIDHPDVLRMLQERGVTHVYIGQLQGMVNSGGHALDINQLLASPHYQPLYHQDRVWIFSFSP